VYKICVGLVAVTLLAASVSVLGAPSLMGYTGLLLAPTADALGDGQYNVAVASTEAQNWEDRAYLANFGLQPGLEAGVQWWHSEHGAAETLLNLKYRFQPPTPGRASLAVGVSDLTGETNSAVYFVASKNVGHPIGTTIDGKPISRLTLHGGIGGGWIDDFFFGLEARLGDRLTLIGEHFNDDLSVGARLRLWRHFTLDAGYINAKDWSANLSYNYPLGAGALEAVIGN